MFDAKRRRDQPMGSARAGDPAQMALKAARGPDSRPRGRGASPGARGAGGDGAGRQGRRPHWQRRDAPPFRPSRPAGPRARGAGLRHLGINERAGPADIGRLTAQASTPAAAAELSAAALPVRVPDTPAERARLDRPAAERRRPPGLLTAIERMVAEAG
jgi:hypothetical protein